MKWNRKSFVYAVAFYRNKGACRPSIRIVCHIKLQHRIEASLKPCLVTQSSYFRSCGSWSQSQTISAREAGFSLDREKQIFTLVFTSIGWFRVATWPNTRVFGLWEETREPWGKPTCAQASMQTQNKKMHLVDPGIKPKPSSRVVLHSLSGAIIGQS